MAMRMHRHQVSYKEVDGTVVFFNEAEAIYDEDAKKNPAPLVRKPRPKDKNRLIFTIDKEDSNLFFNS